MQPLREAGSRSMMFPIVAGLIAAGLLMSCAPQQQQPQTDDGVKSDVTVEVE